MVFRSAFLLLALGLFGANAFSQTYPAKPVRLIIAFTPGSSTDIVGRALAAKLQEMWGQPVVAETAPVPAARSARRWS